jgi:hypothetical protein
LLSVAGLPQQDRPNGLPPKSPKEIAMQKKQIEELNKVYKKTSRVSNVY